MGDAYLLPASLSDPSQTTWKLIYRDARSVIFVKNVPEGVEPLSSPRSGWASTASEATSRILP
jgi:hypothetical protein